MVGGVALGVWMNTIWKYTIARIEDLIDNDFKGDLLEVSVPMRGPPISAGYQDLLGLVCWAQVNTDAPETTRRFWIVGTGRSIDEMFPKNGVALPSVVRHLSTTQLQNGEVYHIFCEVR